MQIAILNQSTKITDADAATMTEACAYQLAQHVAPKWAMIPVPVVFYAKGSIIPSNARPIALLDRADTAGALGYHTEEGGKIWGRVFANPVLNNGGVVLCDPKDVNNTSIASVLSHEVIEMFIDPFINSWCDGPAIPQGNSYALEACDPVEADSYIVKVQTKAGLVDVAMSNFVEPRWFDEQCERTDGYDYLNKLKKPFSMTANGYIVVRKAPGTEQQVYGATHPGWKRMAKLTDMSRSGVRTHAPAPVQVAP